MVIDWYVGMIVSVKYSWEIESNTWINEKMKAIFRLSLYAFYYLRNTIPMNIF